LCHPFRQLVRSPVLRTSAALGSPRQSQPGESIFDSSPDYPGTGSASAVTCNVALSGSCR
jgi:hypothetical protein